MLTTAASWTSGARVLITLGAELAARGDIVTVACLSRSALERSVEATFPRLPVRGIAGQGAFARIRSARGIVAALRPDAVLVHSEPDSLLAAMATGRRGGVVRRWSVGEDAPDRRPAALTWRSQLADACTRLTSWGRDPIAVSWPGPSSRHVRRRARACVSPPCRSERSVTGRPTKASTLGISGAGVDTSRPWRS